MGLLIVIRLKGESGRKPFEEKTLDLLRLRRKFTATLLRDTPEIRGMLRKVEYAVTWGEADERGVAALLERRGRLIGEKRIGKEVLEKWGFKDFNDLAQSLISGKVKLTDLKGLKPFFRLAPPSGGFKGSIKKHYSEGGELGYRGRAINELVLKMA